MKVLRIGAKGDEVMLWQNFLVGQGYDNVIADGIFGTMTLEATIGFQSVNNLQPDGVVGNKTIGMAMIMGFGMIKDTSNDKSGTNWPAKPSFKPLTTNEERSQVFGKFDFTHKPLPGNKENIVIMGDWVKKNITKANVPQLKNIAGLTKVNFHIKAAHRLEKLWMDWEKNSLLHLILTWHGSFVPRFIRGSNTTLSNHAFGTAFDINYNWNKLGSVPALVGQKGSVRELVEIANANGFYWGGHFKRLDGMHFEAVE